MIKKEHFNNLELCSMSELIELFNFYSFLTEKEKTNKYFLIQQNIECLINTINNNIDDFIYNLRRNK